MRWVLYLLGAAMIGYGGYGLLTAERGPEAIRYLIFFGAGIVAHDLLLAPAALTLGAVLARLAPSGLRGLLAAGLFASLATSLMALPFVLGYGYRPDLPSALPLDYGRGLAVTLAGIWTGVALVGLLRWATVWHRRRDPQDRAARLRNR